jgi:hypothetical protein
LAGGRRERAGAGYGERKAGENGGAVLPEDPIADGGMNAAPSRHEFLYQLTPKTGPNFPSGYKGDLAVLPHFSGFRNFFSDNDLCLRFQNFGFSGY